MSHFHQDIIVGIIAGIAFIVSIISLITLTKSRSWKKLFDEATNSQTGLSETLDQIISKINSLNENQNETTIILQSIQKQLDTAVQHLGIIRYNSNGDDGGNLSFSLALLNDHRTGVMITSLHGRQSNRIYSKIINEGVCESNLSEEEEQALKLALNNY